ncbi:acyltransferase [Colwellia sp. 6M3]|uniref:acyltransferase family protein n=1 Tax=Colwellia sp. 6M3 TaxID=2759849 RepID=UPI0015F3D131|nr:acyltransferase [Colwellia sp. 6M3]MBA6416689.1 acyltransferase [Colwellia sp. 6M3]
MQLKNNQRLPELDWLRVILIFAVFIHHVCMPFNGDNWHIMNTESSKLLDDVMVYFEQFRLPTLFFISGIGAVILLSKISVKKFASDKLLRLLIPLIVGVLFVVPPQSYIENISQYESFWQAYPSLVLNLSTNHLWFIEYLIVFSLLAIPLNTFLNTKASTKVFKYIIKLTKFKGGLFLFVSLLIVIKISFSLFFPSDDNKIENLSSSSYYLFFFITGMIFVANKELWQRVCEHRLYHLIILLISTVIFYGYYYSPDLSDYLSLNVRWSIWWFVCCLVSWSALLTILGYAQFYLKKTPQWLRLSNELIYPFYIFHQTVIVVIGFYVINWQTSILIKIISLLFLSLITTCGICLFIIKPFNLFRFLFGLKLKEKTKLLLSNKT